MQDKTKPKPIAASSGLAAPGLVRSLVAECLGTLILVATVVGSGIMGAKLAGGNTAIALLGNTIPTGAILVVLISILGPVSGAHFNPVVTMVMRLRGGIASSAVPGYIAAQIVGGALGAILANAMFDLPAWQISTTVRGGTGQWIAEVVATFGLLGTILGAVRYKPDAVAVLVGLYITAAYWFTSSTSFANPAVSIARIFSDTFAGISRLLKKVFYPLDDSVCGRSQRGPTRLASFCSITGLVLGVSATVASVFFSGLLALAVCQRSSPCRSWVHCSDTGCSAGCSRKSECGVGDRSVSPPGASMRSIAP